jgi:hypothetical protein
LGRDLAPRAAVIAVLAAAGLQQAHQLVAVLTLARLPSAIAEGASNAPRSFPSYPMDLPAFRYEGGER